MKGCVFWLLHCFSGMFVISEPSNLEVQFAYSNNVEDLGAVFVNAKRKLLLCNNIILHQSLTLSYLISRLESKSRKGEGICYSVIEACLGPVST